MASFVEMVEAYLPQATQNTNTASGLFTKGGDAVPLRSRAVSTTIHCDSSFAATTETFAFVSDEDVSVVFKFPLPPRAAVHKLVARVGERTIITEVKPKEEAREEFAAAVQQGHTAVIAAQESSSQIFTLELGNLEAMTEAVVEVKYLRLLDSVGGALEYVHTATWTPPYTGSAGDAARGEAATMEQNPRFAAKRDVKYTLSYDVRMLARNGVRAVESTQAVMVQDSEDGKGKHVSVSEEVGDPSKDFTLLIDLAPAATAPAATPTGTGYVAVQECLRSHPTGLGAPVKKAVALATFVPGSKAPAQGEGGAGAGAGVKQEIIFVVDCSGSMEGGRITQAREAALFFIKDLPTSAGVRFNVVAFGSGHKAAFPACKDYSAASMAEAVAWVQDNVHANMGGTEILQTFNHIYATPPPPGYSRQVIFLTDGGISGGEEAAVYELVSAGGSGLSKIGNKITSGLRKLLPGQSSADPAPAAAAAAPPAVLCLGIGHGVHRGLLDGMASRSGGVAQYVVDGESIVRKAGFLKKAALAGGACVLKPRVVARGALVRAAPHTLPPRLFPGEPLHVLLELVKVDGGVGDVVVELQGELGDGTPYVLPLPLATAPVTTGDEFAVLHAMCWVSSLLAGTSPLHVKPDGTPLPEQPSAAAVKEAVVRAACAEHLVTQHTAAVGVLLQADPLDPHTVKKVEVPLAVPHGAIHFDAQPEADMDMVSRTVPQSFRSSAVKCKKMSPKGGRGGSAVGAVFGALSAPFRGSHSSAPPPAPAMPCVSACPAPPPMPCASACQMEMEMPAAKVSMSYGVESEEECDDGACLSLFMETTAQVVCTKEKKQAEMAKPMARRRSADQGKGGAGGQAVSMEVVATGVVALSPDEVVSLLNMRRTVDGVWGEDEEVAAALASALPDPVAGAAAAKAAQPAELSGALWVSVLALAFLRKHCGAQKGVWEAMHDKAIAYLEAHWPAGARALGFTVLAAMKFV